MTAGRPRGKAKFDRKAYNRKYQAEMRLRRLQYLIKQDEPFVIDPTPCKTYVTGPVICSTFACARVLSLVEQLAGGKCTGCMGVKKLNINHVIKYK